MTTQSLPHSTGADFTFSGLVGLANGSYVTSSAVDLSATDPLDVVIEVECTPGTVSGNKQAKVFVLASLDGGTTYGTGGTGSTDEPVLLPLGILPLPSNSTLQRKQFSMRDRLGFVPAHHKLVIMNDSGAAFSTTASTSKARYYTYTGNSA